ncbi:phage tail tape measure protein, partial [Candidatus Woesebacteria bacterium RIFOXYA1_FULL_38_9]
LNKLGIATKDAEGNLRDFNSIATELYQQRQLGLISDTAFQETARAIGGGGNRRQAAVTTLIENYARVQQVAALSATANGEASEAMGRRLDTVQTSTTRLNNAFQSLAMSLGNEGGLLDLFGNVLDIVTGITSGFDALTSAMGKAGPLLMTLTAGGLIMRMQGPLATQTMGAGVDKLLMNMIGVGYANTYKPSSAVGWLPGQSPQGSYAGGRFMGNLLSSTPNLTNMLAGSILTGITAVSNLANKEDPYGGSKAAGNLIGAAIGAALIHDWNLALKLNQELLKIEPQDVDSLNRLSKANFELNNHTKAKTITKKVLKIDPLNSIAIRAIEKYASTGDRKQNNEENNISPGNNYQYFIEESGKTKTISLLHLGDLKTVLGLDCGYEAQIKPALHRVSICTQEGVYIGRLPDDLAARLIQLMRDGCCYQAYIKATGKKEVIVFIREVSKSDKCAKIISFPRV